MRIVEEEKQPVAAEVIKAAEQTPPIEEVQSETKPKIRRHSSRKGPGCLKTLGCLVLMLVIILSCLFFLVIFVAGPIVKTIDELPGDFPKSFAFYQLDKAKIEVQTPENKEFVLNLVKSLPEWSLSPFMNYLSPDIKTQVLAAGGLSAGTGIKVEDLQKTLQANAKDTTVSLAWDDVNKNKEDLAEYYKAKLKSEGFTVKEKISDYEIDLSFLRGDVTGALSVSDSFSNDAASLVNMTINYLADK
jgi:hypothetical protein